jgi:hypothetical protein
MYSLVRRYRTGEDSSAHPIGSYHCLSLNMNVFQTEDICVTSGRSALNHRLSNAKTHACCRRLTLICCAVQKVNTRVAILEPEHRSLMLFCGVKR